MSITNSPYVFRRYITGNELQLSLLAGDLSRAITKEAGVNVDSATLMELYNEIWQAEEVHADQYGFAMAPKNSSGAVLVCYAEWLGKIGRQLGLSGEDDLTGSGWIGSDWVDVMSIRRQVERQFVAWLGEQGGTDGKNIGEAFVHFHGVEEELPW